MKAYYKSVLVRKHFFMCPNHKCMLENRSFPFCVNACGTDQYGGNKKIHTALSLCRIIAYK